MRLETQIAVNFVLGVLETFSRHDFALVLAGVRHTASSRDYDRLLERWRRQHLVVRNGQGEEARFRILDNVRSCIPAIDPVAEWSRPWDGRWRVFSFDLPEIRRKDRLTLWRQLRDARFGCLQRSVWVWPHDIGTLLDGMVEARNIPECFCGFESTRLFLCENTDIVGSAWDWRRIRQDQETYLRRKSGAMAAARRNCAVEDVVHAIQNENDAYRAAVRRDPFLPRNLWPDSYDGPAVHQRHEENQESLRGLVRQTFRRE